LAGNAFPQFLRSALDLLLKQKEKEMATEEAEVCSARHQ
jgi:hypothetical protein